MYNYREEREMTSGWDESDSPFDNMGSDYNPYEEDPGRQSILRDLYSPMPDTVPDTWTL